MLRVVPLAALALAAGLCGGEDPVAMLEGQKRELLAATVEKREFWGQVERKGAATKRLRELEARRAELEPELAGAEARRAAVEPSVAQAREVNQRAEEVKAEIARREDDLAARMRDLEGTLERFDAGRPAGGGG